MVKFFHLLSNVFILRKTFFVLRLFLPFFDFVIAPLLSHKALLLSFIQRTPYSKKSYKNFASLSEIRYSMHVGRHPFCRFLFSVSSYSLFDCSRWTIRDWCWYYNLDFSYILSSALLLSVFHIRYDFRDRSQKYIQFCRSELHLL